MIIRVETIRETSFVGAGYAVAELATFLLIAGLLLAELGPDAGEVFLACTISFLVVYRSGASALTRVSPAARPPSFLIPISTRTAAFWAGPTRYTPSSSAAGTLRVTRNRARLRKPRRNCRN
jgi:hypothetical protein